VNNPAGFDISIIAGDIAPLSRAFDVNEQKDWWRRKFVRWAEKFTNTHFVLIPGNHDILLRDDPDYVRKILPDYCTLLIDETATVAGKVIYGTPWVPVINHRWAFEADDEMQQRKLYEAIPGSLDILVTHTPPTNGIDTYDVSLQDADYRTLRHFGSAALYKAINEKQPKTCVFGHVHSGSHNPHQLGETLMWNVSRVNESYIPHYDPTTFEV